MTTSPRVLDTTALKELKGWQGHDDAWHVFWRAFMLPHIPKLAAHVQLSPWRVPTLTPACMNKLTKTRVADSTKLFLRQPPPPPPHFPQWNEKRHGSAITQSRAFVHRCEFQKCARGKTTLTVLGLVASSLGRSIIPRDFLIKVQPSAWVLGLSFANWKWRI